ASPCSRPWRAAAPTRAWPASTGRCWTGTPRRSVSTTGSARSRSKIGACAVFPAMRSPRSRVRLAKMALPPSPPVSSAARNALMITAAVAVGVALFFLRPILTPFALALFLMVIIDGLSRVLQRRLPSLGERGALAAAILVTVAGFGLTIMLIAGNAPNFISQLVADEPRLNTVIKDVAHRVHMPNPPSVHRLARQLDPAKYAGGLAQTLQGLVSTFLFILIYLGFLFASRGSFRKKAVRLFPTAEGHQNAADAFDRIRNGIERYLWV